MPIDVVDILEQIVLVPQDEASEILQNVKTLLSTRKGTVQLEPEFGVTLPLDQPSTYAQAQLTAEIVEAVERWEPRATVESVNWKNVTESNVIKGAYFPQIRIVIHG